MTVDLDIFGRGRLHEAALENDEEKALVAVGAGEDPNHKDKYGSAPLHIAAQSSAVDVARVLLDAGAIVDLQTPNGHTPLFFAVVNSKGKGDTIALLRNAGADPYLSSLAGMSPIYVAQYIGDCGAARFFSDLPKLIIDDT